MKSSFPRGARTPRTGKIRTPAHHLVAEGLQEELLQTVQLDPDPDWVVALVDVEGQGDDLVGEEEGGVRRPDHQPVIDPGPHRPAGGRAGARRRPGRVDHRVARLPGALARADPDHLPGKDPVALAKCSAEHLPLPDREFADPLIALALAIDLGERPDFRPAGGSLTGRIQVLHRVGGARPAPFLLQFYRQALRIHRRRADPHLPIRRAGRQQFGQKPAQRLAALIGCLDAVRRLHVIDEDEVGAVVQVLDSADILVAANGLDADARSWSPAWSGSRHRP